MPETVAVVGASPKPERYSNKAIRLLREYGHSVLPVNPAQQEIEGLPVTARIEDLPRGIDTVTMYVGPEHSGALLQPLLGAVDPAAALRLRAARGPRHARAPARALRAAGFRDAAALV